MRQKVSEKTCRKLSRETGLKVIHCLVRGGTNHRYDLFTEDGLGFYYRRGEKPIDSGWRRSDEKWLKKLK